MDEAKEPATFDEALARFKKFLTDQGYPSTIQWITPVDVIFTGGLLTYVRAPLSNSNEELARQRFSEGIANHIGILLSALCSTKDVTFCYSWVPKNEEEGEQTLQPRSLKLAAPASPSRLEAEVINSWLSWLILRLRHFRHQKGFDLRFSK